MHLFLLLPELSSLVRDVETVNEAHAAALAPFRQEHGGYRVGASFRWLLAAP